MGPREGGVGVVASVARNWKFLVLILTPLVLLPLLFLEEGPLGKKFRAAYVILLMAVYWMVEALPLAVTSFLPIVLFPLLGVQATADVSKNYMKETNMMFVGGLIIALAVEYCNLHKRVALRVMTLVGTSPIRLMLGIMLTTMFLSMWISNTATTAMMVPIVLAVLEEFKRDNEQVDEQKRSSSEDELSTGGAPYGAMSSTITLNKDESVESGLDDVAALAKDDRRLERLRSALLWGVIVGANVGGMAWPFSSHASMALYRLTTPRTGMIGSPRIPSDGGVEQLKAMLMLAVAYSSNLGGCGTLTGTAPNLILQEIIKKEDISQGGKYTDLTFATWMAYNVPPMLVNVLLAWAYLVFIFVVVPNWRKKGGLETSKETNNAVSKLLGTKYKALGPMSFHEIAVALVFFFVVGLWLFREPKFMSGWANALATVEIGDSTAAMLAVFLLFVIPSHPGVLLGREGPSTLLDWKFVQSNLPWGVVILMGGGFALSDASDVSGLSMWVGDQLNALKGLPPPAILLLVMLLTATITEVASNTACANVLIPILIALSKRLDLHPLYLSLPATVTCSFAFMLPVATPPNAIVYAAGDMKIVDMVRCGAFLNVACIIVLLLFNMSYGNLIFSFSDYTYAIPDIVEGINNVTSTLSPL